MKTGQQIVTDLIALLRNTALVNGVSETDTIEGVGGDIYRSGTRPRDSKEEDIVVIFTTGDGAQFQSGVVTLNIFVPYIACGSDGVLYEDSERCEQIESLAQTTVNGLTANLSDYKFRLRDTIHTQQDDEINQSFVVVRLSFQHIK